MDERIRKLAYGLVNHSCHVQKGEKVYIHYTGYSTTELAKQLIREVYRAGGMPFPHFTDPKVQREMLLNCTKEQIELMAKVDREEMEAMDCYIGVRARTILQSCPMYRKKTWLSMINTIIPRYTMR
ncbi:MAG: aminopeptidase [Blautia marasmi]